MSLSKKVNPSLVLVLPRKTCPFITERLLMVSKKQIENHNTTEDNQSFSGKILLDILCESSAGSGVYDSHEI